MMNAGLRNRREPDWVRLAPLVHFQHPDQTIHLQLLGWRCAGDGAINLHKSSLMKSSENIVEFADEMQLQLRM